MKRVLIDAAVATDATKIQFTLTKDDFFGSSLPVLRSRGLGTGDSVAIYEQVNGGWQDSGNVLDDTTVSLAIYSLGTYSVDITMATAGPASVEVQTSGTI